MKPITENIIEESAIETFLVNRMENLKMMCVSNPIFLC